MYMPLQLRLTGFYLVLLISALTCFGLLIERQATRRAYDDLDQTLSSRAASVQLGKMLVSPGTVPSIIPGIAGVGTEGVAIEILDRDMHLLASTDSNPANIMQPSLQGSKGSPIPWDKQAVQTLLRQTTADYSYSQRSVYSTVTYQGQQIRVYSTTNNTFGRIHIIQTARSEQSVELALTNLRLILWGTGSLIVVCAALGGWLLMRGVLLRVRHLTMTARAITQKQHFSQRVVLSTHSGDELSQLAATFNTMLDQLEHLYHYQQRFIADASHELRAPITSIRCNLDLLTQADSLAPEERREALADTKDEAERMGRLVNDLLTLAHADASSHLLQPDLQQQRMHQIDLDSLILEVFRQYRPGDDKKGHPRLLLQDITPVQVLGNGDQLKQALVALVDNALKYTPADGTVTLRLTLDGSWCVVSVRDTGPGIAPEDISHIFERFYRSVQGRTQDGSGLGLAIARSIVMEHKGTLHVESVPGQGSTFTICLPLKAS
ncbi:two-component sensor histidine kinase [Dictyobacter vulcani]|uniref:histidine kinase n=1 Tax=Dictyobacter vulcani TaxID=2607529 RepID=A0A5J4KVW6_9CHLR|nr:HAMP domain-containing sensor histidine kinase [Dictyobacter vulcani]GER90621.1 two-component sensor histidine kinase [Dictyobacter vulcani]